MIVLLLVIIVAVVALVLWLSDENWLLALVDMPSAPIEDPLLSAPPCPRQAEATMQTQLDHATTWRLERGLRTCSYCGSMHPDEFMAAVEAGARVTPTDKNYKVYIDVPESEPDQMTVTTSISWVPTADEIARGVYQKFTRDLVRRHGLPERYTDRWGRMTPRGDNRHMKHYFQHLSDEQRTRFVELMNAGTMTIAMPGHFYTLPFFARREAA